MVKLVPSLFRPVIFLSLQGGVSPDDYFEVADFFDSLQFAATIILNHCRCSDRKRWLTSWIELAFSIYYKIIYKYSIATCHVPSIAQLVERRTVVLVK